MEEEFKSEIIFRIKESLERVEKCVSLLSEEQIWDKPNINTNSIGNLILHLQGNVRQYILSSLGSQTDQRNRVQEFDSNRRINKNDLVSAFKTTIKESIHIIEQTENAELIRKRKVQGFDLSGT